MSENKKGYSEITSCSEVINGGNYDSLEPEKSKQDQLPELQSNTVIVDVKEVGNTNVVCPFDNGQGLYDVLFKLLNHHIDIKEYQAIVVVLWIMKTWCTKAFKVAPILAITAMTKGAGKTQLLTLVAKLSRESRYTSDITPAALYRYIEEYTPTLCIDEADSFLNEKLRGVLNSGFEFGGTIVRCDGPDNFPRDFNVFCDKAIAGIGALPETVQDRSIVINMRRKSTKVVKQKVRDIDPAMMEKLKAELERWGYEVMDTLSKVQPIMPLGLSDRKQDCWGPLLAIAELFGEDISLQAREAAILISGKDNDEPSIYEELLRDIQNIFELRNDRVHISTQNLIAELCEDAEAPWRYYDKGRQITPRQLAKILKQFDISSKQIRIDATKTLKGYLKADFLHCFSEHLI